MSLNKARPRYNLGNAYNDASATDMAITEYKEAVRLRPSYKEPFTISEQFTTGTEILIQR